MHREDGRTCCRETCFPAQGHKLLSSTSSSPQGLTFGPNISTIPGTSRNCSRKRGEAPYCGESDFRSRLSAGCSQGRGALQTWAPGEQGHGWPREPSPYLEPLRENVPPNSGPPCQKVTQAFALLNSHLVHLMHKPVHSTFQSPAGACQHFPTGPRHLLQEGTGPIPAHAVLQA